MRSQLRKINRDIERNTRTLRRMGKRMERQTEKRIRQNRSAEGKGFTPLAESTKADKARKGQDPSKSLIATGAMERSFRTTIRPRLNGSQVIIEPVSPPTKFKARLHQFGTSHMPARPFLGFSALDLRIIERELDRHIERVLNKHTRRV